MVYFAIPVDFAQAERESIKPATRIVLFIFFFVLLYPYDVI